MLTPTFKHLPPTSSWTHLITLTEEVSDMPDKHVIFFIFNDLLGFEEIK